MRGGKERTRFSKKHGNPKSKSLNFQMPKFNGIKSKQMFHFGFAFLKRMQV